MKHLEDKVVEFIRTYAPEQQLARAIFILSLRSIMDQYHAELKNNELFLTEHPRKEETK